MKTNLTPTFLGWCGGNGSLRSFAQNEDFQSAFGPAAAIELHSPGSADSIHFTRFVPAFVLALQETFCQTKTLEF